MRIKVIFKRYWRVICSSIICVAVLAMFVPCLAYASVGLSTDFLSSLGFGGFADCVDYEGDIISSLTEAITGMTADEVTAEYYNQYYEFLQGDWWGLASGSGGIYDSTNNFNDDYLESMGMQYAMYNMVRPFDWDAFVLYAKARRAAELAESESFDSDSYFHDNPQESIKISSSGLKNVVDYWSEYYKPHENASQYIWSYQSTGSTSDDKINFTPYVPIYMDANGSWGKKNWSSVYVLPFYIDDDKGTDTFYNKYYVHIYSERVDGSLKYYHDMYDVTSGNLVSSSSSNWNISTYPYLSILIADYGNYYPIGFKGYDRYMGNNIDGHLSPYIKFGDFMGGKYVAGGDFVQLKSSSTLTPKTNKSDDYGYLLSSEPFELIANQTKIDYNQIPDNYTITINGDTIYDYDITNPDTGDHGTVNYYITNNYTLPDNGTKDDDNNDDPGSGSGSSSGTVSGNVTVGGKVDVSGKIEIDTKPIDININVNGGGSGSSGTADVPDIPGGVEFDQDVSLNNYYDWMQEQTTGFSGFMKNFFSWLPEPIVIMLCAGFALVILARFLGR